MSNIGFEAGVFANDGVFSYVDMEKVFFGKGMQSALPSVPPDQLKQMLNEVGFSSRQKEGIFKLAQKDVNDFLENSSYLSNFLNPMNGKRPADGIRGDGKRRSYVGKNEIACDLLGQLAGTIGLCDSSLSKNARFATKDDNLSGAIKIGSDGQVIISDNPATWYVSPLDMSLMLLDAIEKDPAARKKVFNRYAAETKLEINFSAFGKDKEKVEEEFEVDLINLLKTGLKANFPKAAYKASRSIIAYDAKMPQFKNYVDSYKEQYEEVKTKYANLVAHHTTTPAEFFHDLDRVSSYGMLFGGIDVDGKPFPGVPEKESTFFILKDILDTKYNDAFKDKEYAGIRAAALLRIVDFTYARDPVLRENAMKWLKEGEVWTKGSGIGAGRIIVSNRATELANEINEQIRAYNEGKSEKDKISEIDFHKQFGFIPDDKNPGRIIFDSDAKILNIRAHLVDLPPTRATVAIWKKAEEAYDTSDLDLMAKLEKYTYDYVVKTGAVAKSKTKNFSSLNESVVDNLNHLSEDYDPKKPETWDSLDVQIAAKFEFIKNLEKDADLSDPVTQRFHDFVDKVEQFMADVKPSPIEETGAITLRNIDNLLSGLIDDRIGVISGGHYNFNSKMKFFEKDFAEIERQQKTGDFAVIEHTLPRGNAIQDLIEMDSYEASFMVVEAAEEFWQHLQNAPEEMDARIELEESPFKGMTYAKITKIERKDEVESGSPYSYVLLHFEAGKHDYEIISTGTAAYIGRNEHGELPPFEVWKDLAGIYKNLGATRVRIECDDVTAYFTAASAFANLGIECVNDQVTLPPAQEEQIRKILEAAIRSDIASGSVGKERYATRRTKQAIKSSQKKVDSLQDTMDLSLCAEPLKENTERLEAAALETHARVTELSEKSSDELASMYTEVRDAGAAENININDRIEITEHFADGNPGARDILTLARLQLQVEGGAFYDAKTLGLAISENDLDRAEYIADKKDKAQELIAEFEAAHPTHIGTADAFKGCFDSDFDSGNPDAKPEAVLAAMQNICNALSKNDIPDDELFMDFTKEMARQDNIDASIAEYRKLRDHCKGSLVIDKSLKDEVDNFNAAASYALAELRKSPNEIGALLAKHGADKALQDKISSGEALNLQDIVDLSKAVAKEWNGTVITPQRAMELEQKRSYEEVEYAVKQINKKGHGIADGNMRKIAGYAYFEASNEIFSRKPVDYIGLKEQIDSLAFSKIAELGNEIGNKTMQTAKSLDDLKGVALSAKEFDACMEVLGLKTLKEVKALQKTFQNYIKEGKIRS